MKRVHFIGIGGIGMSGLASMYKSCGYIVSGSDRDFDKAENQHIIGPLKNKGIKLYLQDGSYVNDGEVDFVVHSTAIEEDNPDLVVSDKSKHLHRSKALQKIVLEREFNTSIAISGSCGKSSVTALLSETLSFLGADITFLNGAINKGFVSDIEAGNFHFGGNDFFVFEADESDKSLINYTPDYAILLNIGTDHHSKEELVELFGNFINKVKKGAVILDSVYETIKPYLNTEIPIITFSETLNADIVSYSAKKVEFADGNILNSSQVGFHNAVNSLACYKLLNMLNFDKLAILQAIEKFSGVARRFDYAQTSKSGVIVYDDYAHNPEKILSCLKGAREIAKNRIILVFQPHGYAPLKFMRDELFNVLEKNLINGKEEFIMLEPFYAGGTSSFSPSAVEVVADYKAKSETPEKYNRVDKIELDDYLEKICECDDVLVIMGARDNSLSVFAKSCLS